MADLKRQKDMVIRFCKDIEKEQEKQCPLQTFVDKS